MKKVTFKLWSDSYYVKGEIDHFTHEQAVQRVIDLIYPKTPGLSDTIFIRKLGETTHQAFKFTLPGRAYKI